MHVDWNGYGYDIDTTTFCFMQLELDESLFWASPGRRGWGRVLDLWVLGGICEYGWYAARNER